MGFICACCFAAGESEKCAACEKQPCPDCKADKVLLKIEEDPGAPELDAEDYQGFLHRFEGTLLPAYQEHFENDVRRRWRTRCEVARAMIFSQAMHNVTTATVLGIGVAWRSLPGLGFAALALTTGGVAQIAWLAHRSRPALAQIAARDAA